MPIFTIVSKTHKEEPGDRHQYTVTLKCPEGHTLKLLVTETDFEGYMIGDAVDVKWGIYQSTLPEVLKQT